MERVFVGNWCRMAFVMLLALVGFSVRGADNDAHEAVDLGLPSGTKWASCNVGATSPEQYGDYYAWGEVETKSEYTALNNITDGKELLCHIEGNPQYDVACAKWGGDWRLPNSKECEELCENCTWKWTTLNGVKGMMVTSKKNKKSIFLPAAGDIVQQDNDHIGKSAGYWSGESDENGGGYGGYHMTFDSMGFPAIFYSTYRFIGYSVRPVK